MIHLIWSVSINACIISDQLGVATYFWSDLLGLLKNLSNLIRIGDIPELTPTQCKRALKSRSHQSMRRDEIASLTNHAYFIHNRQIVANV